MNILFIKEYSVIITIFLELQFCDAEDCRLLEIQLFIIAINYIIKLKGWLIVYLSLSECVLGSERSVVRVSVFVAVCYKFFHFSSHRALYFDSCLREKKYVTQS